MSDADPPSLRESALHRAVLAGEPEAWRSLYDLAFEDVYRHVSAASRRCPELTDEVVQETWMIAVRRIHSFDPSRSRFATWLKGIADNVFRNFRRRQNVHVDRYRETEPAQERTSSESPPDVRAALRSLSPRYRAILQAKYFDGRSVKDIALAWQQSEKAIESVLGRARAALREALDRQGAA